MRASSYKRMPELPATKVEKALLRKKLIGNRTLTEIRFYQLMLKPMKINLGAVYQCYLKNIKSAKNTIRNKAKQGLELNLDYSFVDFIDQIVKVRGYDDVIGVPMQWTSGTKYAHNYLKASFCRKDHSKGYYKDNIKIQTWYTNIMQGRLSDHEFERKILKRLFRTQRRGTMKILTLG